MSWFKDFRLLLWKNFLLQKRQPISTIFEILLPVLFIVILLSLRVTQIKVKQGPERHWPPFSINNTLPLASPRVGNWMIAFSPNTTYHFNLMKNVPLYLNAGIAPFETASHLQSAIVNDEGNNVDNQTYLCGVVFESDSTTNHVKYKLRFPSNPREESKNTFNSFIPQKWYTEFVFPFTFQGLGPRTNKSIYGGPPNYFREGFLSVQRAVDFSIIKHKNDSFDADNILVEAQRFPYPSKLFDPFITVIQGTLPFLLMLSLVYTALCIVKSIVHEKERKLKESMKMMGLRNWIHWLAWFTKCALFLLIPMIIITILMCVEFGHGNGKMLAQSNGTIVFIFLLMYAISSIMFCFFISTLFSKANIAAAAGGILWFLSYVPNMFLFQYYDQISTTTKILSCLDFQLAMSLGANLIGRFEGQGSGLQWSNINKSVTVDTTFTFAQVLLMFLLDTVLYGVFTWYIEAVFPGDYGLPKRWYFPFMKGYWRQQSDDGIALTQEDELNFMHSANSEFIESDPENLNPGIRITNLRKVFKTNTGKKVAVNDLSLNLYEGEITALLGHNGAGKTTTISMLTGLIPPTSGTAVINNYNILKNIRAVRKSLGICPQHNVLFDNLTVEEHLWFFASLKCDSSKSAVSNEINRMLESIGLLDKRNMRSKTLSGGMKRKLSVGMALVGDSKIVMLDEPTSGMDVSSRRFTWDLLQKERKGRTILLTTHYMDEADVLGDRIAIMTEGDLQCCGSSLFLKKKYGVGYHMVIVKNKHCDVKQVDALIRGYIPTAVIESNAGLELSFILPSEYVHTFEDLFVEIEERREELGINSYGASITTLEEVFLKVCEASNESETHKKLFKQLSQNDSNQKPNSETLPTPDIIPETIVYSPRKRKQMFSSSEKNTGWTLSCQRWYAMFMKRFLHSKRHKIALVSQLVMPGFFMLLALIVVKFMPKASDSPPRVLDLNMFGPNYVVYNGNSSSTYNLDAYKLFIATTTAFAKESKQPIVDYLLWLEYRDLSQFNLNHLVALDVTNSTPRLATVWFNNEAIHSPAVSLSAFTNGLLRTYHPESTITPTNDPLPPTSQQSITDLSLNPNVFQLGSTMVFAMSFMASSFIVFLVQERATGAKHVQFVSGVGPLSYWSSAYAWDLLNYSLPMLLIIVLFQIFQQEAYVGDRTGYVIILLVLYGWAIIPCMYLFSFLFKTASTAYTRMTILNVITGLATLLVVSILSIPALELVDVANTLKWTFLALPNYNLGQGTIDLYNNYESIEIYNKAIAMCVAVGTKQYPTIPANFIRAECKKKVDDVFANQPTPIVFQSNYLAWDNPGIGRYLIFLAVEGFLFFGLVLIVEYINFRKRTGIPSPTATDLDSDVRAEQIRVANGNARKNVLEISQLTKVYGTKRGRQIVAVDNLSLGIHHGECFGLLGQNGAGKTSTFKMLTGDESLTSGNAFVDGHDVTMDLDKVRQKIGYCPQFDALIDLMTGRELLTMYSRLRGVPEHCIKPLVESLAKSLSVDQYLDKITKTYSGGNKRKLSTAIALAGDPPLVFLDEPSSGMDPVARRLLWNSLSKVIESGNSIVITSHLMEECEALCTRLAIMVNGQFKCIGSPQHLKNKFGTGYTLIARVGGLNPDTKPLKRYIEATFTNSVLKDEHLGYLHYQLKDTGKSWANVFGVMENAKKEFNIEDYSVSQTTLEQVFLNFTRAQKQDEE